MKIKYEYHYSYNIYTKLENLYKESFSKQSIKYTYQYTSICMHINNNYTLSTKLNTISHVFIKCPIKGTIIKGLEIGQELF